MPKSRRSLKGTPSLAKLEINLLKQLLKKGKKNCK
jgi:hypothetical protein